MRLLVLDGDPHSDYINANYIDVRLSMGLGSEYSRFQTYGCAPSLFPRDWPS